MDSTPFKSEWIIPWECRWSSPLATSKAYLTQIISEMSAWDSRFKISQVYIYLCLEISWGNLSHSRGSTKVKQDRCACYFRQGNKYPKKARYSDDRGISRLWLREGKTREIIRPSMSSSESVRAAGNTFKRSSTSESWNNRTVLTHTTSPRNIPRSLVGKRHLWSLE